jgi:hypothetical protein
MRRDETFTVGRLQEHGRAPYPFGSSDGLSYYVRVLTDRGVRVLWGKDLERAITQSATRPKRGDLIGARRVGRVAVPVATPQRDVVGRIVIQSGHFAQRNRWVVEKVQFFAARAKLARSVREVQADIRSTVKSHPELMSTFLTLRAAQEVAERRIADPRDRERFVALVREAIAGSVKKGEPIPTVHITKLPRAAKSELSPLPTRYRTGEPTR